MKRPILYILLCLGFLSCSAQGGRWTWINGDSVTSRVILPISHYGIKGVPNPANFPPERANPLQWTDRDGNFWMYGGSFAPQVNAQGPYIAYADLWKYNPRTNIWTWIKGDTIGSYYSVKGTMSVPDPRNSPGFKNGPLPTWTDLQGRLWFYGGTNLPDSGSQYGLTNAMWMYDIPTNQWTWMNGTDSMLTMPPVYGTRGVPARANSPGYRYETGASWVRSDGTLWMYGGAGNYVYSDIWKYDIPTNSWAWMNGPDTAQFQAHYGPQNVESDSVHPPGGYVQSVWQDENDQFYTLSNANTEVWRYNPNTNRWSWLRGSGLGTGLGLGALTDTTILTAYCNTDSITRPGNNVNGSSTQWLNCKNVFWQFGGTEMYPYPRDQNTLYTFNPKTNKWTWVSGDHSPHPSYHYGTKGVTDPANMIPPRYSAAMWADSAGRVYVWGGQNYHDMWRFDPDTACIHPFDFIVPVTLVLTDSLICPDDSAYIRIPNGYIVSITPPDGVVQHDSAHASISPPGHITYTVVAARECSMDSITFTLTPVSHIYSAIQRTFCIEDPLLFGRHYITASGVYRDTLPSRFGCDSVVTLTATVLPASADTLRHTLCSGQRDTFAGHSLSLAGIYYDTLSNSLGCDSIVTLLLTILPPPGITIDATICSDTSVTFHGVRISTTGVYIDTVTAMTGCDSIVALSLHVNAVPLSDITHAMCAGDSVVFGRAVIYDTGVYRDTLGSAAGCDSIVTLTVTSYPRPVSSFIISPAGDSVSIDGITAHVTSGHADHDLWLLGDHVVALTRGDTLPISDTGTVCIRLVAISDGGCSDTSQQCIFVFENAFVMPNAFTPNGDGKNDLFYPVFLYSSYPSVGSLRIYDRWGGLVHDDPLHGWDGSYRGTPQPDGAYLYYITVKLPDAAHPGYTREIGRQGTVTLIR